MSLLMLFPLLGTVLFLRRKCRLSDSAAILHAVSGFLLLLYTGALLGLLQGSALALAELGLLLLAWELWLHFRKRELRVSVPLLLLLALPALYWLVHSESQPLFWDEYSHWGVYVREMSTTHQLWSGETNASHADYPPGNALWQYWFILLPGYSEGTVYLAQFVFLLSPLLVLFEHIGWQRILWVPALLALLAAGFANFGHGITSLYTDHVLSAWYAGILLHGLRCREDRPLETGLLALPLAVLLLIKDAGLPLVLSGLGALTVLLACRHFRQPRARRLDRRILAVLLVLLLLPVLVKFSWQFNRESVGIPSGSEGTGLTQMLLEEKSSFSEEELRTYQQHFWEVLSAQQLSRNAISLGFNEFGHRLMRLFQDDFRLTLLVFLGLFPLWTLVVVFLSNPNRKLEQGLVLGLAYLSALVYLLVMYRTYPLLHSVARAQNLVSFLRYAHTVVLPLFLLGMGLLAPALRTPDSAPDGRFRTFRSTWLFGLGLFAFYVFETPHLAPFHTPATVTNHANNNALRWRQNTDALTEQMRRITGRDRLWVHLPLQDNGFLATVLRYQMTPTFTTVERNAEFLNRPSQEIIRIWDDYDYLWFAVTSPQIAALFEKKFGKPLGNKRFLKVKKHDAHITLIPVELRF